MPLHVSRDGEYGVEDLCSGKRRWEDVTFVVHGHVLAVRVFLGCAGRGKQLLAQIVLTPISGCDDRYTDTYQAVQLVEYVHRDEISRAVGERDSIIIYLVHFVLLHFDETH